MPYVNIQITREGATAAQKTELIRGATDLLVRVLNKSPATTFVIINEVATDNWGVAGQPVTLLRQQEVASKASARSAAESREPS
jgi:4-oxalocrotonate tautomerase